MTNSPVVQSINPIPAIPNVLNARPMIEIVYCLGRERRVKTYWNIF